MTSEHDPRKGGVPPPEAPKSAPLLTEAGVSLKKIERCGLELNLKGYRKLLVTQAGKFFLDSNQQEILRYSLGSFLPRVQEDSKQNTALFVLKTGPIEAASMSDACGGYGVPQTQVAEFKAAWETFRQKAEDPLVDQNARDLVTGFKLPNPSQEPDFYRLYGRPWDRKLLVLWGCEKENGSQNS